MYLIISLFGVMTVALVLVQADVFEDAKASTARLERAAQQVEQAMSLPEEARQALDALVRKAELNCRRYGCDASLQQRNLAAVARVQRSLAAERQGTTDLSARGRSGYNVATGSIGN